MLRTTSTSCQRRSRHYQMERQTHPLDCILSEDDSFTSSDAPLVQTDTLQHLTHSRVYHLVPQSWQNFLQLEPPPTGYYDLVEGIVVWRPSMASKEHDNLITAYLYILTYFISDAYSYSTPSLQVLDEDGNLLWTRNHSNSSSITASSSQEFYGLRHPDIIVARRTSAASIDSRRSGNEEGSAGQIQFVHPYRGRIKMIIEITSHSNRDEDLYIKWATYARSGVELYVILDRGTDQTRNFRVIVGSLQNIPGYELSYHGDPDLPPHGKPHRTLKLSRNRVASSANNTPRYYRKVYKHNELVTCEHFSELKKTPEQLLNDKYMTKFSKAILNEQDNQKRRIEQAEREAEEAKCKTREAQETIVRLEALLESATPQGKDSSKKVKTGVDGTSARVSSSKTTPPQTPSKRHSSKRPCSPKTRSPQTKDKKKSSADASRAITLSPEKKSRRKQ